MIYEAGDKVREGGRKGRMKNRFPWVHVITGEIAERFVHNVLNAWMLFVSLHFVLKQRVTSGAEFCTRPG